MEEENAEKLCRTCLDTQSDLLDIDHAVLAMIEEVTQVSAGEQAGLASWVCRPCHDRMTAYTRFRTVCLQSIAFLKLQLARLRPLKEEDDQDIKVDVKYEPMLMDDDDEHSFDVSEEHKLVIDMPINNQTIAEHREHHKDSKMQTIFGCPYCNAPFVNMKIFNNHMELFHSDKITEDIRSLVKGSSPLGFVRKNKGANNEYRCACGSSASEYSAILEHFKSHYGEKPIVCSLCDYRCDNVQLLKKHIKVHNSDKPFACSVCSYTCKDKTALKNHSDIHFPEKKYECKQCPMSFKQAPSLSMHKARVHDKKKNYACHLCERRYPTSKQLKDHLTTHTGEKPHICHLCGRGFTWVANLKSHIMSTHESDEVSKRFKCDLCGFSSKHSISLTRHMARHAGTKNYKCDQCPFLTNSSYTLKIHMLRHTGETRFSCDLCDYKCLERPRLKAHKVIHTGERNFSCDMCSYTGASKEAVKRHKETHSTELKYSCPHCPYKTNVRDILTKHMRKKCQARSKD